MKSFKNIITKVGSKGEIFLPKNIRQQLGLNPNQSIIMNVKGDKLIIRKLYPIEEILSTPTKVKINYHTWKQFKKNLSKEAEK